MKVMVVKKSGKVEEYRREKVENAIKKAFSSAGKYSEDDIKKITRATLYRLTQIINDKESELVKREGDTVYITTKLINDTIEITLMSHGYYEVAKNFIIYRKLKTDERNEKMKIWGLKEWVEDPVLKNFSVNAIRVLASRYPIKEGDKILELPSDIFRRVALHSSLVEALYHRKIFSKNGKEKVWELSKESIEELENKYKIEFNIGGKNYPVNKYMIRALLQRYKELNNERKMKVDFYTLLDLLSNDKTVREKVENFANEVYELMIKQYFMPNTPAIINSGRPLGLLSACFVLPIGDSIDSIMKCAYEMAKIQQRGGGTGMDFSKLRPKGDIVKSSGGKSSGPVSFLKMLDSVSEVVKQAGVRRGANMGIMRYDHPDIDEFITAKKDNDGKSVLTTFNLSVGLYEGFWEALKKGEKYPLINPRDGSVWGYKDAREMFDKLSRMAWEKADPGVIYFDVINKYNALPHWGEITATNPCGEQPLHPYESCNLLSINIEKFVKDGKFDWEEFSEVVKIATRFLNDMLEMNYYPLQELRDTILKSMRIGLGIMGLANALFRLMIPYNSEEGYKFMNEVTQKLLYNAILESIKLAKERGPFPEFENSVWVKGIIPVRGFTERELWILNWDEIAEEIKREGIRNSGLTTMPPTGSVSMIADTSSGIEPIFALSFKKSTTIGDFYYVNKPLEEKLKELGLYNDEILSKITSEGTLQNIEEIPSELKRVFVTAKEIHYIDHIIAQSTIQAWVTEAVSKTINMKNEVTVDDVKLAYLIGHELGLKGVTVYRDGSLSYQVLYSNTKNIKMEMSNYARNLLEKTINENTWIKEVVNIDNLTDVDLGNNRKQLFFSINIDHEKTLSRKTTSDEPPYDDIIADYVNRVVPPEKVEEIDRILKSKNLLGEVFCPVCWEERRELVPVVYESGCKTCKKCGWSACTVS